MSVFFCGCKEQPTHTHNFGTEWKSDQTNHWHQCLEDGCDQSSDETAHEYGVGAFVVSDDNVTYSKKCKVCGYEYKPQVQIVDDQNEADNIFGSLQPGDVIWLKADNYPRLDLDFGNLVIGAEDGAVIDGICVTSDTSKIEQGISNLEFHNLTFSSEGKGFVGDYNILNLSFLNCKFSGKAQIISSMYNGVSNCHIGNFLVDGCEFKGIHTENNLHSAIIVAAVTDVTVTDCVFDGVDYNALQLGERFLKGKIQITGNVFKNIENRYVKLLKTADVTSCDISGNTFYKMEIKNQATDKAKGNYFQTKEGNIVIGVNTWEEIPPFTDVYFENANSQSPIIYNPENQIQLEG